ncbi:MAG: glycosyltransferase family 9 protein [Sphingobacteriia bacterium]|jgi:ADP-heptose:LPS heptosyltransferase
MLNRIKGILYDIVLRFAMLGRRQKRNPTLFIVRTDEIGDYMLWRKCLPAITEHYRALNYEIHLIGNSSWKSLFDRFDLTYVDKAIWVDKIKFKKKMGYRFGLLRRTYLSNYAIAINPTFSRDKRNDDAFVIAAKANQSFGMKANLESVKPYEIGYDQSLYTNLFDHPERPIFEFYRNQYFTEFITEKATPINNTTIERALLPTLSFELPEKFIVVFPGSRSAKRIWPVDHFLTVCNELYKSTPFTVVLCGASNDKIYTDEFAIKYKHSLLNLTGKTSLTELLTVFSKAALLISVDTGSIHLATAVGCKVAGIFNGSQYKRFAPYPPGFSEKFIAVYPDEIETDLSNETIVKEKYEFVIDVSYSKVLPEKLIKKIKNSNIVL